MNALENIGKTLRGVASNAPPPPLPASRLYVRRNKGSFYVLGFFDNYEFATTDVLVFYLNKCEESIGSYVTHQVLSYLTKNIIERQQH